LERKALFLRSKNAPKIKKVPLKLYQIHDFLEIGIADIFVGPNEEGIGKREKDTIDLKAAPPPTAKQVCGSTALSLGRKRDKSRQSKTPFLAASAERM
jgi:hypothetical protein